ncbi:MAG: energy transducer TonB [Brevundimonas sp.]|uniref:energy transducer TonB n=1 Tax=Brevundimonas sp. TaxID=1871086 RepID=UPI001815CFB7|nr:energy transducer TonB [Brevundimonas sp.]MBA4805425.1 energy transducer TonB [Brevundimonas sp.]
MTDIEYHRSRYDPPKTKVPMGVVVASLVVVSIIFAILAFYFMKARFEIQMKEYSDEAVDVEIIEPIPPPPPPPPPVTLPIEPTKKEDRVEYTGPPVIVPGPPPPPAPPAPPRPSVITQPSWSRPVQPEFPERAQSRGIEEGSVEVSCTVRPDGSLANCQILNENPSGAGFGQAVLSATRRARVSPRTVDGAAQGATVRWTVRFRLG